MKKTNRGFGIYAEGVDYLGNKLTVIQSSLAFKNAVRIYADNPYTDSEDKFDCITIDEEGAKLIIEGLQAWLLHINGEKNK